MVNSIFEAFAGPYHSPKHISPAVHATNVHFFVVLTIVLCALVILGASVMYCYRCNRRIKQENEYKEPMEDEAFIPKRCSTDLYGSTTFIPVSDYGPLAN